jgi:hypothetical protein
MGTNLKRPKVLQCFDYHSGNIDQEKGLMFISELDLFPIGTISLPLEILEIVVVNIIKIKKTTKITNARA